jgi:hypothetical protein
MVMIVWKLDLQLPVQSVPITTKVVSSNPVHGEVYSIQHFVIKFVSGLRWVDGFIQILRFPPPIKLTATKWLKYCWKWQCRFILFLLQFFQMYNAYVLFQLSFLPDTNDWQASILYPIWLKLHVCSIFFFSLVMHLHLKTYCMGHIRVHIFREPSWSWLYGSWIYNYLCNQCLSPQKLWVWTPFMTRYTWYNIMW